MYIEENLAFGHHVGYQLALPGITYTVIFDTETGQVFSTCF